ncbi:sugar O-acetyltransferase [Aestuariimicrobium ganziense]|uniref:sugar O-acetyltransferase n=1 Tax=Aestuariimicrobium ganziense TaxID=2773677 RepID=UPI0019439982|nr:sugar O-acetyltransferase [Aestuariimicrobium ganziense]
MTEEERALSGQLFAPGHPDLVALKTKSHLLSQQFNALPETDAEGRQRILEDLFAGIGEKTRVQGPIQIHYGCHTTIGHGCFMNFNFTVQDDGLVTIGDHCSFGPNCTIVTPQHPLIAEERRSVVGSDGVGRALCWAEPVTIGNDCWFGANVVVTPGVTIGDNCVIGAGSVVTSDIPANSIAVGVPARVVRQVSPDDTIRNRFTDLH